MNQYPGFTKNQFLLGLLNPSYLNAANNVIEVDDNDDSSNEMNHQVKFSDTACAKKLGLIFRNSNQL